MRPLRVCIYKGQLCYKRHPPATKLIVVKKIKLNFIDTEKLSKFYFFMVPALVFMSPLLRRNHFVSITMSIFSLKCNAVY